MYSTFIHSFDFTRNIFYTDCTLFVGISFSVYRSTLIRTLRKCRFSSEILNLTVYSTSRTYDCFFTQQRTHMAVPKESSVWKHSSAHRLHSETAPVINSYMHGRVFFIITPRGSTEQISRPYLKRLVTRPRRLERLL